MNDSLNVRGRGLSQLVAQIREKIGSSHYSKGGFLPPTRQLAAEFGLSAETVRRGLKVLEKEGLLVGEPRSGFRIATERNARLLRPVAFVTSCEDDLSDAQPATWALSVAFQGKAAARGWSLLGVNCGGGAESAVAGQLAAANAWGVILDSRSSELYDAVMRSGLPVVMAGAWTEDTEVDIVLQDNYRGGFLAAEYLISRGRRRVGWIGPIHEFSHTRERFAGVCASLGRHGLEIAGDMRQEAVKDEIAAAARKLLAGEAHPDAILAFGPRPLAAIKDAAAGQGLVLGEDFDLVGWVVEEAYDLHYRTLFAPGQAPPAVTWSAGFMADRVLALLAERSEGLREESVRVCVPTRLKLPETEA
jgi:DNA-binding LacI/PurR family transcriptional regulator